MIVSFCFSSSLIVIISIPSLVCGSTKRDFTIETNFIKKPIPPQSLSFLLTPIHFYPGAFTFSFCGKCVSHKAIISQGLFIRICFRKFTFDLIPLPLEYIKLISFSVVFFVFSCFLWFSFYLQFLFDFHYSFDCLSDLVIYNLIQLFCFYLVCLVVFLCVICCLCFMAPLSVADINYMLEFTVYFKLIIFSREIFAYGVNRFFFFFFFFFLISGDCYVLVTCFLKFVDILTLFCSCK